MRQLIDVIPSPVIASREQWLVPRIIKIVT